MPQQTPAQARVIDPVLSTVAQGYKNAELVGLSIFPRVPVAQRGGTIITFGKEDFALYATARAPGAATKRVQFGHSGSQFALKQHALEGAVPFEQMDDAAAVPGINMASVAVNRTQNIIDLRLEKAQADLATTAANFPSGSKETGLTGSTLLSHADSDPLGVVEAGKEAIRGKIGRYPNTILLGAPVMSALKKHPKILDRIKYTGRDVPSVELLASLFDVEHVVVGKAVYVDEAGNFVDVWGKNIVLAYTELGGIADMGRPSFGYTYRLNGAPIVETPYQDRNAKTWVYPVTDEVEPVMASPTAGYLVSPAVA